MSDSAISDFMNITGCQDHSRAKFYIDSSNGDLDAAVIRLLSNIINQTDFWKTHPCKFYEFIIQLVSTHPK